jgi:hypothetical protein
MYIFAQRRDWFRVYQVCSKHSYEVILYLLYYCNLIDSHVSRGYLSMWNTVLYQSIRQGVWLWRKISNSTIRHAPNFTWPDRKCRQTNRNFHQNRAFLRLFDVFWRDEWLGQFDRYPRDPWHSTIIRNRQPPLWRVTVELIEIIQYLAESLAWPHVSLPVTAVSNHKYHSAGPWMSFLLS